MIVDDDKDVREAVHELLEASGYQVRACQNGTEALELISSGPRPCLILLDLMMPVSDGWKFREAQRRVPELLEIPILVMSAAPLIVPQDLEHTIAKPFTGSRLLEIIGRLIRGCRVCGVKRTESSPRLQAVPPA